jgi:choice-of-anchor C domain-containing protein
MRVDRCAVFTLALCASLIAGASRGAADMLTNGDFESGPAMPPTGLVVVPPGNPALTGWTVTGGAITIVSEVYWDCLSGVRSVALSSTGPGAIQQTFTSASGSVYRLSFGMTGEPFTQPAIKHLRVQAGATTQEYTFDVTPAWHWDMKWQTHTLDFVAPGPTTTVTFTSLDASANGPVVDVAGIEFVTADATGAPARLSLAPVAPDPLRGEGQVSFTLPMAQPVRLAVVDLQGREVAVLAQGTFGAGPHALSLAPRSIGLRSGLYFMVLQTGDRSLVRRFTTLQ